MAYIPLHQLAPFPNPVPGQPPEVVAFQVRGQDNSIVSTYNAHDADSTIHLTAGNAPSATTLSTLRKIWSQPFNGSADVTGAMANVTTIAQGNAQTTVSGAVSGTAIFSQPDIGASFKQVLIYCAALRGAASYVFPTPFSFTPEILSQSLAAIVTSLSTTATTVTGLPSTGFITLNGY